MTQKKIDAYEVEALRGLRNARRHGALRICASTTCDSLGEPQPRSAFYGKDSYCKVCRKVKVRQWRLENPAPKNTAECLVHKAAISKCGCKKLDSFFKSPEHKEKIGQAMRGNHNAAGSHANKGVKLSAEHRARISASMKARNKEAADANRK